MMRFVFSIVVLSCLSGCIVFDHRSDAVTFHQLTAPATTATRKAPAVFIPRTLLPAGLRRANIVLMDDAGRAQLDDNHRWLAPLDRAFSETVGRHLTRQTGLPVTFQAPAGDHCVLLLTLDDMGMARSTKLEISVFSLPGAPSPVDAIMQVTARWEKADGTPLGDRTFSRRRPLKDASADAFVSAQSTNLAEITAEIATLLPTSTP